MKYLILYSTKTGSSKKCAALIAANLNAQDCDVADINGSVPDLSGYDAFIAGSYIRMGRMDRKIVSFIKKHADDMPFGIFACGCFPDRFSENIVRDFPDDILEKAAAVDFLGSETSYDYLKGADRVLVKLMDRIKASDPGFITADRIMTDRIVQFADEFRNYIKI